jgi:hypothetical protein
MVKQPQLIPSALILTAIVVVGALGQPWLLYSEEGAAAAATLLLLGGIALVGVLIMLRPEERRAVGAIFCVGLALRALTAVVVYHWNPLFFSLDQAGYSQQGAMLAARWHAHGGGPSLDWLARGPDNYFAQMWAMLSYFVGPSELALRMAMVVVGAYSAVRVYILGRDFLGQGVGLWAGWLAACWPSLVIWSSQGLRDPLLVLLYCEAGLGVLRIHQGRFFRGLVIIGLSLYGFTILRPYGAVVVGLGCCLALLIALGPGVRGTKLLAVGATGLMLLFTGFGFLGAKFLGQMGLEALIDVNRSFQGGGSSFGQGIEITGHSAAVRFLPVGLTYFFFAPFPWQMGSALQMSTMLERPLWYLILALAAFGVTVAVRRRGIEGLIQLVILLPATLLYALAVTNVGTAYRDRAQLLPCVFIYAVQGVLVWRARRATARQSRPHPRHALGHPGLMARSPSPSRSR